MKKDWKKLDENISKMFLKLKYNIFISVLYYFCIKFIIWMYDIFGVVLLNYWKCKNMSNKVWNL